MPFDFRHARFTTCEGGLCYFAASHSTVLVGAVEAAHVVKVCQITFNKVGSVLAQFTYFGAEKGVVAAYASVPGERRQEVRLGEAGLVASVPVKYSHPPDGNAHFSQDGQALSKVRRQSIRLDGPEGHLFELHTWGVDAFERLEPGHEKSSRLYLPWIFTQDLPGGVVVVAEWRSKAGLRKLKPRGESTWGPLLELPRWLDGRLFKAMLLGQPKGYPLQDHLLVLNVGAIDTPASVDRPTMVFFGGWDEVQDPVKGTGYLAFLYPAGQTEEMEAEGRTIDWPGRARGRRDSA